MKLYYSYSEFKLNTTALVLRNVILSNIQYYQ